MTLRETKLELYHLNIQLRRENRDLKIKLREIENSWIFRLFRKLYII